MSYCPECARLEAQLRQAQEDRNVLATKIIYGEAQLGQEREAWRCFFCDFKTSDAAVAAAHFGDRDDPEEFKPICKWWERMSKDGRVEAFQDMIQRLNELQDMPGEPATAPTSELEMQLQAQVAQLQTTISQLVSDKASLCSDMDRLQAHNRDLTAALQRATKILKAWADNDVVSDDVLMEMTDEVIPLCSAALATQEKP